jgi:hypothetical protein
MPRDKEPSVFISDDIFSDQEQARYSELFAAAEPDQICGEASTDYTKLPTYTGMAERAYKVLGPDTRLIYIVREPVARLLSHHHHLHARGLVGPDVNQAVRQIEELVACSKYAMQAQPWIDQFGPDHLLFVPFEKWRDARQAWAERLWEFLGLSAPHPCIDETVVANVSQGKPVHARWSRVVTSSGLYRNVLRKRIPESVVQWVIQTCLPRAASETIAPTAQTVMYILEQIAEDQRELQAMMGSDAPLWDLKTMAERYGLPEERVA